MSFIQMKNVFKKYGKAPYETHVIKDLNLEVEKGEMLAVMGKSGCGKSTLLNILGGLDTLNKGSYYFNKQEINTMSPKEMLNFRRKNIGFVVQYFALIKDLTVFENISLPLHFNKTDFSLIKEKVNLIAEKLGIEDKLSQYCYKLSRGESQRVAIARALIKEHSCILADEPTGSLDDENSEKILSLFQQLNKEGETIIIVTHDIMIAEKCNRIVRLKDGFIEN